MNMNYIAGGAVLLVVLGALIMYQQNQAQAAAAAYARTPGAQIGGGIGSLVGGIIGLATGSGGTA